MAKPKPEPQPEQDQGDQGVSGKSARLDVLEAKLTTLLAAGKGLEADVRELAHDLTALATLAGQMFGEPFRSKAAEIVTKRQTGNGRNA